MGLKTNTTLFLLKLIFPPFFVIIQWKKFSQGILFEIMWKMFLQILVKIRDKSSEHRSWVNLCAKRYHITIQIIQLRISIQMVQHRIAIQIVCFYWTWHLYYMQNLTFSQFLEDSNFSVNVQQFKLDLLQTFGEKISACYENLVTFKPVGM